MLNMLTNKINKFQLTFNQPQYLDEYKDNIYVFQQFYIPKDDSRKKEINECLKKNVKIRLITKIVLLNEKEYTREEMDLTEAEFKKIQQIIIIKRLKYSIFFEFAKKFTGYCLLANSDIFFDETLVNIFKTPLYYEKSCFAQLRIEHNRKLFGPRSDSQDAWLFHSKHLILNTQHSDFELGMPGCDNKITLVLALNHFKLYNEPFRVNINHLHTSNIRGYSGKDVIPGPYLMIYPYMLSKNVITKKINNNTLKNYIQDKINNNKKIYIGNINIHCLHVTYANLFSLDIQKHWNDLMKNSKIAFNDIESYKMFITMYNESLINCDVLINYNYESSNCEYLKCNKLISPVKFTFDNDSIKINNFHDEKNHFINSLHGKKILIVYDNINMFKQKYNKELFKECEFIYLQTNIKIGPWFNNFISICKEIKNLEHIFDIALIDCYGYSNLLALFIYNQLNISTISLENNLKYLLK
jgi:hypothetical protein